MFRRLIFISRTFPVLPNSCISFCFPNFAEQYLYHLSSGWYTYYSTVGYDKQDYKVIKLLILKPKFRFPCPTKMLLFQLFSVHIFNTCDFHQPLSTQQQFVEVLYGVIALICCLVGTFGNLVVLRIFWEKVGYSAKMFSQHFFTKHLQTKVTL